MRKKPTEKSKKPTRKIKNNFFVGIPTELKRQGNNFFLSMVLFYCRFTIFLVGGCRQENCGSPSLEFLLLSVNDDGENMCIDRE